MGSDRTSPADSPADITVRVAESDDELEAWRTVRMSVLPNERCLSVDEMRAMATWPEAMFFANADMRALNERLGYVERGVSITVRAPIPLPEVGA